MPVVFSAFTHFSDKIQNVLITKARIRLAQSIATIYKIPFKDLEVEAIWDTGATRTAISRSIVRKLNLIPIARTNVQAAGNSYISDVYKVDIFLPNRVIVNDVHVTEAKNIQDSEILIGMDIINIGDFSITNADEKTYFSFRFPPDNKHIDYVEMANKLNKISLIKRIGGFLNSLFSKRKQK